MPSDLEARVIRLEQLFLRVQHLMDQVSDAAGQLDQNFSALRPASDGVSGTATITVNVVGCNGHAINNVPVTSEDTGRTLTPAAGTNSVTFDVPYNPSATNQDITFNFSADPTGVDDALRFELSTLSSTLMIPAGEENFTNSVNLTLTPQSAFHCCQFLPIGQPLSTPLFLQDAAYGSVQLDWSDGTQYGIGANGWYACASGNYAYWPPSGLGSANIHWVYAMVHFSRMGSILNTATDISYTYPIDATCTRLDSAIGANGVASTPGFADGHVPYKSVSAPTNPTVAPDSRFSIEFWYDSGDVGATPQDITYAPWNPSGVVNTTKPLLTVKEV